MIDLEEFANKLANSGVDKKLQEIAEITKEKMAAVEGLDIAAGSPSALFAVGDDAFKSITAATDGLLDQAKALQPQLPKLQDMMGEVLAATGPAANALQGSLNELIESAGGAAAGIPSVDSLSSSALSSLQVPDLGGLDAAASSISEALTGAVGNLTNAAGGIQAKLTTASVPSIGSGGFDPGKMIPNIEFKTEPTFDVDGVQNGTRVVAIKLGSPATVPVQDGKNDAPPKPVELTKVFETMFTGLEEAKRIATKHQLLKPYKSGGDFPTTEIVYNKATKRNIVYETQTDESGGVAMVPSGFPSQAEFDEAYSQGMEVMKGGVQQMLGAFRQIVPEATAAFQETAQSLADVAQGAVGQIHRAQKAEKEPGRPIERRKDPITGAPVDIGNVLNIFNNIKRELPGVKAEVTKQLQDGMFTPLTQLGQQMEAKGFTAADVGPDEEQ